jgi:hypothetical protein
MDQDKRRYRKLKRDIKAAGNRKRRRTLQRALQDDPQNAADVDFEYGRDSSATMNGNDHDSTRRRKERPDEDEPPA